MRGEHHHALDHLTDVAAVGALTVVELNGGASPSFIAAVVTVATGARYAKAKWGKAYE
jgi:hypothetical protein